MKPQSSVPKAKSTARAKRVTTFEMPSLPSLFTQPLGLEGWAAYEPVLIAALASGEPLLLIGAHGSAKSFLLERLAQSLGLEYRFYNASLINYDDLVGFPIPDEERKSLRYISTPSAIWDAQVVFFDEINRTRPELQNKLFPIIHERRVQGIKLDRLIYRWSAMNPPPSVDGMDDTQDIYLGAEPLDPALADRFAFLIEVPTWQHLTDVQKRAVFRDQFRGEHDFPVGPSAIVAAAQRHLALIQQNPPRSLEDYMLTLLAQFDGANLRVSTRRATMLHRNILAVHAARLALYERAFPSLPAYLADWDTSALLALQNSLPDVALGRKPDPVTLLAAHRHAWEVSQLDADNPWRELFAIQDPLDRCIAAIKAGTAIDDDNLSRLVLEALSNEPHPGKRRAIALAMYAVVHKTRSLQAAVYETLSQAIGDALIPSDQSLYDDDFPRAKYRQVADLCEQLERESTPATQVRDAYALNLLNSLIPEGYGVLTPRKVLDVFQGIWKKLLPTNGGLS